MESVYECRGRKHRSGGNCEVCGSLHGGERKERGSSDSLSRRTATDRDTAESRHVVSGGDAGRNDCKCIVVYSDSGRDKGRGERILKLSWDADSLW